MAQGEAFDQDTLSRAGRLHFRARRIVEGVRAGTHRSPLHGASVEFAEHKEYAPGDALRHIDWKVLARSDKYYVKRFEEETNLLAWILLDVSASMGYGRRASRAANLWQRLGLGTRNQGAPVEEPEGRTKHDYATLLSASLAYLLQNQGDAVSLFTFGGDSRTFLPPRTGSSHLQNVMEALAGLKPSGVGQIAQALTDFAPRVTRRGVIILISDLLEDTEEILRAMKGLRTRRNDVLVLHVLHQDELAFPFEEVSRFEDPEDRDVGLIADPREMKEGYLKELQSFLELVRRRCLESQVEYALLDTSRPVSLALAELLGGRISRGAQR